jgi:hypothetical protein
VANTPDCEEPLYFYAARGSAVEQALRGLGAGSQARATLAIRAVDGSHQRKQFEVTELLAGGWVR